MRLVERSGEQGTLEVIQSPKPRLRSAPNRPEFSCSFLRKVIPRQAENSFGSVLPTNTHCLVKLLLTKQKTPHITRPTHETRRRRRCVAQKQATSGTFHFHPCHFLSLPFMPPSNMLVTFSLTHSMYSWSLRAAKIQRTRRRAPAVEHSPSAWELLTFWPCVLLFG